MTRITNFILKVQILKNQILNDTKGQDLIEYALLAGFIAVGAAAAVPTLITAISSALGNVGTQLGTASS